MSSNVYDLAVVGGGAAGFSAAIAGAEAGASVLLVTHGPLGGTCVNFGCVPTKYLLEKVKEGRTSLRELLREAKEVSKGLREDRYERVVEHYGIPLVRGRARFLGRNRLLAGGREFTFKSAVIAVGARTKRPPVEGIEEVEDRLLDNESFMQTEEELESVIVVGGRAQGIEFSQIFARAGVDTTLIQRSPRLLPNAEPEASESLKEILEEDGVRVITGSKLRRFERTSEGVRVILEKGSDGVEADRVFLATGRRPLLGDLGLEALGVEVEGGFIKVDRTLRAAPNIYAAGDCVGEPMAEPVAAREGYLAAMNALGKGPYEMDYAAIPRAVFTHPEYAWVGLTEEELSRRIGACACRTVYLRDLPRGRLEGLERGFVKIVVDPRNRRVAGVHILAPKASEMIQAGAVMLRAGFTLDDLIDTVMVFPTLSEGLKHAALAFYRDVKKMPCCLV